MCRPALRPHRSAIVRLRSGAVASRSGAFRVAAFRCGGGGPRGWHGRAGASARRSLRPRLPVRLGVRASSAHERHPAWSEYLPAPPAAPWRRCAHPAARARSGPVPRRASAGALVAHVRFCGARPAPLTLCKGIALARNCAQLWGPYETVEKQVFRGVCPPCPIVVPSPCHGRAERVGGAAARGGASTDGGARQTPPGRLRGA